MPRYNPKNVNKKKATKRKTKDLDEVWVDSQPENAAKIKARPLDEDLPGMGAFYCIACARHFVNKEAIDDHNLTKPHKRRVKTLESGTPYGVDLSEVYGMKVDNGANKS